MSLRISIELPSVPPSLNRSRGGNQGRNSVMKQMRLKRQLQDELWAMLRTTRLPRNCNRIEATASLRFPVRRPRDEGNFRAVLEKALGDALQSGGYLENDTPEHFCFGALTFEEAPGPRRTVLTLTYD